MTGTDPPDGLSTVLDELIDLVQQVKQARWRFGSSVPLRDELDSLFDDVRSWARRLIEEEEDHGHSPLDSMRTASVRQSTLGISGIATAEDVRRALDGTLERVGEHLTRALALQADSELRAALTDVDDGLRRHRRALGGR
jgi:hypothetical protein